MRDGRWRGGAAGGGLSTLTGPSVCLSVRVSPRQQVGAVRHGVGPAGGAAGLPGGGRPVRGAHRYGEHRGGHRGGVPGGCRRLRAPPRPPAALLRNSARREKSPGARPLLDTFSASGLLLASIPVSGARTGPGGGSGASAPPGCPEGLRGSGACGGHRGLRARAREPARPGRGGVGAVPGSREHRAPCTGLGQTRGKLPSSRGAAEPRVRGCKHQTPAAAVACIPWIRGTSRTPPGGTARRGASSPAAR